ncbi:MAG: hypothetical protein FJX34_03940 [Alphaproteobacteria bacterium]|nr:hypothetical protein [Alphaproteobacteria bacterium]
MRRFFCLITFLSLFSCGFQVIYRDEENNFSYAEDLAAIRIKKDRDHLSQELKNNLYDLLNPDYIKTEPKYFLIIRAEKTVGSTFTTQTGASGRNRITINVSYELKNLDSAEIISKGTTSVNDSYDVSTNRYGTYVADDTVQLNLTKIAAQNLRNLLVNDFIEIKKKCEGKVKTEEDFICPLTQKTVPDHHPTQH